MAKKPVYNRNQLKVLYYLKRNGPLVRTENRSIIGQLSLNLGIGDSAIRGCLKQLEDMCVVLRTWAKGRPANITEARGNALIKVELVDPGMSLPPEPHPLPVVVLDAIENEELYQRTTKVPSSEETIIALLERNEELQAQIEKLQEVVVQLNNQLQERNKNLPEHLTQRVRTALTPEQWESLSHSAQR